MKTNLLPCIFSLLVLTMVPGTMGAQESETNDDTKTAAASSSTGGDYWHMPNRIFELGIDVDAGFGNTVMKIGDVFNIHKTLLVDLSTLGPGEFYAGGNAAVSAFLNLNIGKDLSFGIFAGVQMDGFQSGPKEFTDLLRKGNARTKSVNVDLSAGGSVFADAGIRATAQIKKLHLTLKPAAYSPLIYVPPPDINFDLSMDDSSMALRGLIGMDVYSAFPLNDLIQGSNTGNIADFVPDPIPLGFDMTLEGVYSLLPALDLGLGITNLPLFPAKLRYRMRQETSMVGEWSDMYSALTNGDFDMPGITTEAYYEDDAAFWAFRPLRFDFFVLYRPVEIDLFVFRPHIGFSVLTIHGYDTACFNAGLDGQINIANVFSLSLGTGYMEHMWKHAFGIRLNFRAIELDAEISLRGPDFVNSFKGRGLGANLGIRLGF